MLHMKHSGRLQLSMSSMGIVCVAKDVKFTFKGQVVETIEIKERVCKRITDNGIPYVPAKTKS